MKIAIPIWEGRVSPVMDTACQLLIVDLDNGQELSRTVVDIPRLHMVHIARFIGNLGIDVIICGAISRQVEAMLAVLGIRINAWIRGEVEEVILAYADGNLKNERFFLPGCRGGGRRRGLAYGQRHQRGFGRGRFNEEDI